ncbi:MAG TPA: alkaline phosphatase D family protein [Chitinophagaceae bacterium]|nr:alkaline phosphatase D family protein [Chitinophagaceae bacterium]
MKVAFASCSSIDSKFQHTQPIWGIIRQQQPNLLLLLGDNVYISKKGYEPILEEGETIVDARRRILEGKYRSQTEEEHFKKLLDKVDYLAVWDNHDFGLPGHKFTGGPNAISMWGAEAPDDHRKMARELFDEYLKKGSQRPFTEHVYCCYEKEGVKFFMLDVRSHQMDPSPLFPNRNISLLGSVQEEWLLEGLHESRADINVICSGIPYSLGSGGGWQPYGRWVNQFNRMVASKKKVLFLGGNIHGNGFKRHRLWDRSGIVPFGIPPPPPPDDDDELPETTFFPGLKERCMYEIISSGVGQKFKCPPAPGAADGDDDDDESDDDKTPDWALQCLPRNNYGIIDIGPSIVRVTLYGQHRNSMHFAEINREDWTLSTYQHMKEADPS